MSIKNKYFSGTTVSRYLSPTNASWNSAVYQSGKPVLDSELNLDQDISREIENLLLEKECASGFLRGPGIENGKGFIFTEVTSSAFEPYTFKMPKELALVAGMPVVVEHTNTTTRGENKIQVGTSPTWSGTPPAVKPTDFVFLEVFKALVAPSPHGTGTIEVADPVGVVAGDAIVLDGVGLTAVAGVPGLNEFQIGLTAVITAGNIRDAINLETNSFTNICTAQLDVTNNRQVNLRSVDGGLAGNITFVSSNPAALIPNPNTGNFAGGSDRPNKPTQNEVYVHGNVQAPTGVNLPDNIEDPIVGTESTQRVQTQYRIRVTGRTEAVNQKTQNGFNNVYVWGQGTTANPVEDYIFLPADRQSQFAILKVLAAPVPPGFQLTINGTTLTSVAGPRTPGNDDFDGSSGVLADIATEISAAINDGANSFASSVSSVPNGTKVQITNISGNTSSLSVISSDTITIDVASTSAINYGILDQGLFIAGDGSEKSANDLGTVDGYVYAIPICFVFRRNDASGTGGFDPLNNTNGAILSSHGGFANTHGIGAIPAGVSDRPDQNFLDAIVEEDVLDLRRSVSQNTLDLKAELQKQMALLLDGSLRTWAIDAADKNELGNGSGDVSWRFLVCNEIGRDGGTAPISGDTTRGDLVANFDHVRRRFADQSVVERRLFPITPNDLQASEPGKYVTKAIPAHTTWTQGDVINIDLDNLNATGLGDWSHASQTLAGGTVSNFWPAGTKITNVLSIYHDDGYYGATPTNPIVEMDQVIGLGTAHVQIRLAGNERQANGGIDAAAPYFYVVPFALASDAGSPRRIFVELEITYPVGVGCTDTPDKTVSGDSLLPAYFGASIENDSTQRPLDWEELPASTFREGKREIGLEYVAGGGNVPAAPANTPVTDQFVTFTLGRLRTARRIFYSASKAPTVTEVSGSGDAFVVDDANTSWGSSARELITTGATIQQQLVEVTYFCQDPIPNYGGPGGGYQISTYYRSNAPQTVGVKNGAMELPASLTVQPLVMSSDLWSGNISVGSNELPYPYVNPSDQIPVNSNKSSGPTPEFPGEWVLQSQAKVSLSDFDADTGLLNLHTVVPTDPNSDFRFDDLDRDIEFRAHYRIADPNAYRPTAMARNSSNPHKHKVWMPMLVQSTVDNVFFRKGEVLLLVVSRFATLSEENIIIFDSDPNSCAAIYRTNGILLLASER